MSHAAFLMKLVQLGMLASCTSPPPHGVQYEIAEFPVTPTLDLDLLFLFDDSPSMADKQANLASSFPKLIEVLSALPGGLPSVHIGVATSDLGTQAALDAPQG